MTVFERMSRQKSRDTVPEMRLRRALRAAGASGYRVHLTVREAAVRVRPDVVFRREKIAVFVDGCYWHGCPEHACRPKSNAEFWDGKFAANRRRDENCDNVLRAHGWIVIREW